MLKKTKNIILEHKYKTIITLILIIAGSYYAYSKLSSTTPESKYVFAEVKKDILISSVSGSGQVNPVNEIDLKPEASGKIIYLNAVAGTKVSKGQIIAKLDTKDLSSSVRDARANLESAEISYDRYKTDNSDEKLLYNLTKSYDTAYNATTNALSDIPTITNNIEDIRNKETLSESTTRMTGGSRGLDLKAKADSKFYAAESSVKSLIKTYSGLDRKSSNDVLEKSLTEAYKTTKIVSDLIKSEKDFIDYMYEESGRSTVYSQLQTSLSGYNTTINNHLNNLLSAITSIHDSSVAYTDTSYGLKTSKMSIIERQNALADVQDKFEDYLVRAPFEGMIASSDIEVGDQASPSTVVAKLITEKKVAEISLNEVDVASVKIGQKATLTFDAISDLSISGTVSEIDLVGTVSQGVVTYNVKITFDTTDDKVKPGMTANASIITDRLDDVLLVSNSAIKKQNGSSYVEMASDPTLVPDIASTTKGILLVSGVKKVFIETGLSNDDYTQVISGINVGDKIVVRTITTAAKTGNTANTTTNQRGNTSSVRMPGMPGF